MKTFQIYAICGIAVVAAILGIVITTGNQSLNADEFKPRLVSVEEPILIPPSNQLNATAYGFAISDVAAAQSVIGYKAYVPSYLPFDNSLRITKVNPESKYVILMYSPIPITDKLTLDGLLSTKGILIIHSQNEPSFDSEQWIKANVDEAPDVRKAVSINGMSGMATEYSVLVDPYGTEYHIPAKVIFFRGTTQIELLAKMSPDELIKVAESMK